ncbi:hypothetical protein pb186bvf_013716 [Paramecium bursaria]
MVGYPLDFIKTRMQISYKKQGAIRQGISIIQEEGFRSLYRGLSAQLVSSVIGGSIYFTSYELARRQFIKMNNFTEHQYLPYYQTFLSGSFAVKIIKQTRKGIIGDIAAIPLEYVKILTQKQQIKKGTHSAQGPFKILYNIIKDQVGGSKLQIIRDGVGCGFFFLSQSVVLQYFTPKGLTRHDASQIGILFSSISAGVGYWVIGYPIDIIKTRYQVTNENISSITRSIYSQGGVMSFYKGFKITIARSVLVNIFALHVYENTRRIAYKYL